MRLLQAEEEELRRLRATEETAPPMEADMELATCFGGDITLTARGQPVTLSPDQVRPGKRSCLSPFLVFSQKLPSALFEHPKSLPV